MGNISTVPTPAESLSRNLPDNPARPVEQASGGLTGVRKLWAAWKKIARKIGDFQARVLLTLFYFILLAPFAIIVRRRSDPLALKSDASKGWIARAGDSHYTVEMARKQF